LVHNLANIKLGLAIKSASGRERNAHFDMSALLSKTNSSAYSRSSVACSVLETIARSGNEQCSKRPQRFRWFGSRRYGIAACLEAQQKL
jgi:hypothetical protein